MRPDFILVTGPPRSGTTAVGGLLAQSSRTFYLYEPTNFHAGDRDVSRYFMVPASEGFPSDHAKSLYDRVFDLRLRLKNGVWAHETGLKRIIKPVLGGRTKNSYRWCKINRLLRTIVWKDPFMLFSLPFITQHYDIPIVVTQRRIEGVAASFKRFGWGFDVKSVLDQLSYRTDLSHSVYQLDYSNPVINATALCCLSILEIQKLGHHPQVMVLDLDGLIDRPVETVERLYAHCRLDYTDSIRTNVQKMYAKKCKQQFSNVKAHVKNRDLSQIKTYWSKFLTESDQALIAEVVDRFGCSEHRASGITLHTSDAPAVGRAAVVP